MGLGLGGALMHCQPVSSLEGLCVDPPSTRGEGKESHISLLSGELWGGKITVCSMENCNGLLL